jgi:hypothetical protein
VAGLCLSVLGLIIFVAFVIAMVNGFGDTDEVLWGELEGGECVTDEEPYTVMVGSCDFPHRSEVYAVIRDRGVFPEEYPGRTELRELGEEQCEPRYALYVGVPLERSRLGSRAVVPLEVQWRAGDRWVVCLVEPENGGPLVEPVRGSNR